MGSSQVYFHMMLLFGFPAIEIVVGQCFELIKRRVYTHYVFLLCSRIHKALDLIKLLRIWILAICDFVCSKSTRSFMALLDDVTEQ